jgi:predicted nucleotidyltransferase
MTLTELAEILASWVDPVGGVPELYLFGSRVRGDHRPDSDVDVRLYPERLNHDADHATARWWMEQNASKFAEVQVRLPGRLDLGRNRMDWSNKVDREIMAARGREPILVCRKVVCLWTPPKAFVNPESGERQ